MKKAIYDILLLGIGFSAGFYLACWKMKQMYEKQYEKDSADLQEHFQKRYEDIDRIIEEKAQQKGVELAMGPYKMESAPDDIRTPEQAIELIEPEEFGADDDYETSFLTYYADEELVFDGEDTPVDKNDIPSLIGNDALDHFGEFMPGAIHVRNHNYHKDYEILMARQNFYDICDPKEDE